MANFIGTDGSDVADARTGTIVGFTIAGTGTLQDADGDTFNAGNGDDEIHAGAGNDRLNGGLGADILDGGDGIDTADYSDAGPVSIDLLRGRGYSNAAQGDVFTSIENVLGSVYNDYLIGSQGANRLEGGNGDDVLIGALGADQLIGGAGIDTASYIDNQGPVTVNLQLNIGTGNAAEGDTFDSIENVVGTNYDDVLTGNSSTNRLTGGAGNDILRPVGTDVLDGGADFDIVSFAGRSGFVIYDMLIGPSNITDTLISIEGLIGTAGNDLLGGDNGRNLLSGGNGDDFLYGHGGADTLDGGAGVDTASYGDHASGITVNLQTGQFADGDTLTNVENITGTAFNDVLIGDTGNNVLSGGAGDDLLAGGGGDYNLLDGGDGIDTVSYANSTSLVTLLLDRGFGQNGAAGDTYTGIEIFIASAYDDEVVGARGTIYGGAGNDRLTATSTLGTSVLYGEDGDDFLTGASTGSTLIGGRGADRFDGGLSQAVFVSYASATSAVTINLATGTAGGDITAVGDTFTRVRSVTGSAFADTLIGADNFNYLEGGAGADTITSGGRDSLYYTRSSSGVTVNLLTRVNTGGDAEGDVLNGSFYGIFGSAFADSITGGFEFAESGDGDDYVAGGNIRRGGNGNDTVSFATETLAAGQLALINDTSNTPGGEVTVTSPNGTAFSFNGVKFYDFENITGSQGADWIRSNRAANVLDGQGGDDILDGREGRDTLTGGAGADTFVFDAALGAANADTITDFTTIDQFLLTRRIFTTLSAGVLADSAFTTGTAATTAAHRIIYDQATGALYYDADGNGAAAMQQFASVLPGTALSAAEFTVL